MKVGHAFLAAALVTIAHAADPMNAFPPAEEGMARHVLRLPELPNENLHRLELIVGRTEKLDAKNTFFFGGKIEEEILEGWGFPRYIVRSLGPMAGTRIAVDPSLPKVERFVALGGEPFLLRYNSQLPVVVYVPEGAEVRYRLWSAPAETQTIPRE